MAKYLGLDGSGNIAETTALLTSTGAPDASKIPQTDSNGKLDISLMPTGVGADTKSLTASEALAAGDFVTIYNNGGTESCRKALAADATKPAHGFVLSAVSSSGSALVYCRGLNTQVALGSFVTGDEGAKIFLSPTTGGAITKTAPTATGQITQSIGTVIDIASTVTVNFTPNNDWIIRA